MIIEDAAWESDFGIYAVDNINNPSAIVGDFVIFQQTDEPGSYDNPTEKAIYFQELSGTWYVDFNENWEDDSNVALDNVFGFYFSTNTGYEWYSDIRLNADQSEHIMIGYNENLKKARIYLDDQPYSLPADLDFNDMVSAGDDLAPASVPEPATMLLLGTGLIGIAGVSRKKMFKK